MLLIRQKRHQTIKTRETYIDVFLKTLISFNSETTY